jgi:hypothetical protein
MKKVSKLLGDMTDDPCSRKKYFKVEKINHLAITLRFNPNNKQL